MIFYTYAIGELNQMQNAEVRMMNKFCILHHLHCIRRAVQVSSF